ncbi:hypothetical protein OV450_4577, partial [Actinobacteria bacterium OV450]
RHSSSVSQVLIWNSVHCASGWPAWTAWLLRRARSCEARAGTGRAPGAPRPPGRGGPAVLRPRGRVGGDAGGARRMNGPCSAPPEGRAGRPHSAARTPAAARAGCSARQPTPCCGRVVSAGRDRGRRPGPSERCGAARAQAEVGVEVRGARLRRRGGAPRRLPRQGRIPYPVPCTSSGPPASWPATSSYAATGARKSRPAPRPLAPIDDGAAKDPAGATRPLRRLLARPQMAGALHSLGGPEPWVDHCFGTPASVTAAM